MNRGLIIVSGCPRSGTSVCMDIQREAHGEDKILGYKFPREAKRKNYENLLSRIDDENDHSYQIRKYTIEKQILQEEQILDEKEERWKDMNPEGFWEMEFTVKGLQYIPKYRKVLRECLEGKTKICKIVSQGLLASDPLYIEKIIFMIRHPRAVAKSQERLSRELQILCKDGEVRNMFEGLIFHTPEMFIEVTVEACRFFFQNPNIPVRFYHFEKLFESPDEVLNDMQRFIGEGDYSKASKIIQ
jgi:hypothetical protein